MGPRAFALLLIYWPTGPTEHTSRDSQAPPLSLYVEGFSYPNESCLGGPWGGAPQGSPAGSGIGRRCRAGSVSDLFSCREPPGQLTIPLQTVGPPQSIHVLGKMFFTQKPVFLSFNSPPITSPPRGFGQPGSQMSDDGERVKLKSDTCHSQSIYRHPLCDDRLTETPTVTAQAGWDRGGSWPGTCSGMVTL